MDDERNGQDGKNPLEIAMDHETTNDINEALSEIPIKQKRFIELHFGLDGRSEMNQAAIAERFGVTRSNVNHFIRLGIENLRSNGEFMNSL